MGSSFLEISGQTDAAALRHDDIVIAVLVFGQLLFVGSLTVVGGFDLPSGLQVGFQDDLLTFMSNREIVIFWKVAAVRVDRFERAALRRLLDLSYIYNVFFEGCCCVCFVFVIILIIKTKIAPSYGFAVVIQIDFPYGKPGLCFRTVYRKVDSSLHINMLS